jgi:scyllo-inositol 2-dehydrogenase (NADP+)
MKVILVDQNFKYIVVGLGTQGMKRIKTATNELLGSVDPFNSEATYKTVYEVPIDKYDAAFICTPESEKFQIMSYLIDNGKHVLCEKPLLPSSIEDLDGLEVKARKNQTVIYTAYNHRFEPALVEAAKVIESGILGKLYNIRIFYGNGTARLVKESPWRDQGMGVISDIGSHLIDLIDFLLPTRRLQYKAIEAISFENKAIDHAIIGTFTSNPLVNLEMTFCSWRNTFSCDIIGESGSLHVQGLCKWGVSNIIIRHRRIPAGLPNEEKQEFPEGDPTWRRELTFFKSLISKSQATNLSKDRYIMQELLSLKSSLETSP